MLRNAAVASHNTILPERPSTTIPPNQFNLLISPIWKIAALFCRPFRTMLTIHKLHDTSHIHTIRNSHGHTLQAVFDYVDLQHQAASVKPGTYNLVNSYPRKAFADGTPGSLADVGITADTALFLEPKA
ncbi:hypothetical protein DUNSADRAFT_5244 [Dunaliella salina]|uniref:UBX domain-containing protein n=1 Tax=Dunaliella salina TaxID=3046 RepID=A0ABQ7GQN4_DUNSA|nr:hypothetical protein DUNSADRAFT_5244 [Dunaliella salina]|eukprot:KAF5836913.1 hypothetical protein DUNSADRAFT_5244 [Dunaliella salina]